jgi:ribosomal protein S18 acetylase RimI-like enzyme
MSGDETGGRDALRIRDAARGERDAITAMTLAAYEQYVTTMPAAFWPRYWQNLAVALEAESAAERIVAEMDGAIARAVQLYPAEASAYAGVEVALAEPEIRLLAVAMGIRGRGIGAALTEECLRRARAAGATAVGLHTMPVMAAAVRLYARMGFVRAPETDFRPLPGIVVEGHRLDLRQMALSLLEQRSMRRSAQSEPMMHLTRP